MRRLGGGGRGGGDTSEAVEGSDTETAAARGCGGGNADRDSGPTAHSYADPHACSDRDATHFRLELESGCFLWSAFSDGNGRVAPHRGGAVLIVVMLTARKLRKT